MITIRERLSRIEAQNEEQSKVLRDIQKSLHGNGRRGICQDVEINREILNQLTQWKIKHEKNIKWWTVLLVSSCITLFGAMQLYL